MDKNNKVNIDAKRDVSQFFFNIPTGKTLVEAREAAYDVLGQIQVLIQEAVAKAQEIDLSDVKSQPKDEIKS